MKIEELIDIISLGMKQLRFRTKEFARDRIHRRSAHRCAIFFLHTKTVAEFGVREWNVKSAQAGCIIP